MSNPNRNEQHPSHDLIQKYSRGLLQAKDTIEKLESHLLHCDTCAAHLDDSHGDPFVSRVQNVLATSAELGDQHLGRIANGYEILSEIGRGGMGVVYLARQISLDRLVAIKKIRLPKDSSRALARFRREAEALGQIQHPTIVRIYDFGDAGTHPFLAMEYVRGPTLASVIDGAPFETKIAVELMIGLAKAVAHLNDEGIIHRDFKPQNILLASPDELRTPSGAHIAEASPDTKRIPGQPKIIDFGLAKPLDNDERLTVSGAIVGTPEYMAPEQAGSDGETAIDAHSDVYSIGATLYECLTGRPPFKGASHAQTLRALADQDPIPPSSLNTGIDRDLDTICLKCLEKSPKRRYETAHHLAEDLQRYAEGRAISARPHSRLEKSIRWLHRNPTWAISLSLVVAMIFLSFSGIFVHNRALRKQIGLTNAENLEATAQRKRADENYHRARETMRNMLQETDSYTSLEIPRLLTLIEAQSQEAIFFLGEISLSTDPPPIDVLIDLISTYEQLGNAQVLLGKSEEAVNSFQSAVDTAVQLCTQDQNDVGHQLLLAEAMIKRAYAVEQNGNATDQVIQELEETVDSLDEVLITHPKHIDAQTTLAWARHQLGAVLLTKRKDPESACDQFRIAVDIRLQLMDQDPEKAARYALSASESQINLGLCLAQQGQFESALETYANADEALATFLNENPLDFQSSISRAKNAINRASLLVGIGRAQEAADVATEGLHGIESFVANEPDHFDLNDCMFKLHGVRGQAHAFLEVWDAAANDWRDAQNFAPDPRWSLECQAQQSLCLVRTGHTSEAVELCDEILKGQPSDDTVYNCICTLALAASTIDKAAQAFSSGNFDKTSQLEQAGHLKQLAIDRLEALRQRGYFDHELKAAHALVDTDLDYLRDDAGQLPVEIE